MLLKRGAIEQQRLARLNDPRRQPFAKLDRCAGKPLAGIQVIRKVDLSLCAVVQRDIHILCREDLAHRIADHLDQRAQLQLRRERLPDPVDRLQLGGALALGLEQARIVQRHTHVSSQRGQQAQIGIGEIIRLEALQADHADHLIADEDRHAQP